MKRQWKVVLLSIVCVYGISLVAMERKQKSGDLKTAKACAQEVEERKLKSSSEILEAAMVRGYGCPGMPGAGEHLSDNQDGTFHSWFYRNAPQSPPR